MDYDNKSRGSQIITRKQTEDDDNSSTLVSNLNIFLPLANGQLAQDEKEKFEDLCPLHRTCPMPPKPQLQTKARLNEQQHKQPEATPPRTPTILREVFEQFGTRESPRGRFHGFTRQKSAPLPGKLPTKIVPSASNDYRFRSTLTSPTQNTRQQRVSQYDHRSSPITSFSKIVTRVQPNLGSNQSKWKGKPDFSSNKKPTKSNHKPQDSWLQLKRNNSGEEIKKSWKVIQIKPNSTRNKRILTISAPLSDDSDEWSQDKARIRIKKPGTNLLLVARALEVSKIYKVNKCPNGNRLVISFQSSTNRDGKVLDFQFDSAKHQQECLVFLKELNPDFIMQERVLRPHPLWEPDEKVIKCAICRSKFNVLNRKHHCRMCGRCVCSNCSRTEAVLPEYGIEKPVRVDVECYETILHQKIGSSKGGLGMRRRTSSEAHPTRGNCANTNGLSGCVPTHKKAQSQTQMHYPLTYSSDSSYNKKQSTSSAWKKYLAQNQTLNKRSTELRKRITNGIPPEFRGHVWTIVSDCFMKRQEYPKDYYFQLVDYGKRHHDDLTFISEIEKDLDRPMRRDLNAIYNSQKAMDMLKRVLKAYAVRNRKVEYCQSMNFIGALLLLFMQEEEAFWLFCYIVEEICCVDKQFFYHSKKLEGWIIDQCVFSVMVEKTLPEVSKHLADLQIPIGFLADNWFLCLFVNSLSLKTTLRVWDLMFLDGIEAIFRSALALLKINKEKILKVKDHDSLMMILADSSQCKTDGDSFIKVCYDQNISSTINELHSLRVFHRAHIEQFARMKQPDCSNVGRSLDSDCPLSLSRKSSHALLAYSAKHGIDNLLIPYKSTALHEVSSLHDLPESSENLNEQEKDKLARIDSRMIYMDPEYRNRFEEFSQYFGRIERNTSRVEEYFGTDTPSNRQRQESPSLLPEIRSGAFKQGGLGAAKQSPLPRNCSFSSVGSSNKDSPFSFVEFKGSTPADLSAVILK